jgi:hypothetical protein
MYEQEPWQLVNARSAASTNPAVRVWTAANGDDLALQALALMDGARVPLPPGTPEELASLRIPARQFAGVDTEFHAWNNQELQVRLARGSPHNVGEIRVGDNVQADSIMRIFPRLTENQARLFQLRALIHEYFHALDFRDVAALTPNDGDAAIVLQARHIGLGWFLGGYARNEIHTDMRTGMVLERNGLLFPELRQDLDQYRTHWNAQGPLSEQAFDAVLVTLNRTRYP